MTVIAHLSDLHFGREIPEVVAGLFDALEASSPELIIITGDLTQRATKGQFQKAHRFLKRLNHPYLIVPGNHDMPAYNLFERFFCPWKKWKHSITPELEPLIHRETFTAAGLTTARRMQFSFDWSGGAIDDEQTAHIKQYFINVPGLNLRILAAHHPLWVPPSHDFRRPVKGRNEALAALNSAGVDMILGGHLHLPYVTLMAGMIISNAGSTLSNRLDYGSKNSFTLINGDRSEMQLTQLNWTNKGFRPTLHRVFTRRSNAWRRIG